ncbi:peptide ABC transporter substrate-binding protein [Brucella intermedia]|uniref:peptide ABC transporter substrate-binding protein n=1 Tax=Brucella intermedia TaxID=94625 RepID=UPI003AB75689
MRINVSDANTSINDVSNFNRRQILGFGAGLSLSTMLLPHFGVRAFAQNSESSATPPPSSPAGVIVVGLSQEPVSFHPLMPGVEVDEIIWTNVYSALWVAQPDGSLKPDLATEVPSIENGQISEDGLRWTVTLRDDVKWHDGEPFTAEDVKYSLELINTDGFRARTRVGHNLVKDIVIDGPHKVSWTMTEAFSPYLALLANTHIVPKHILEPTGDVNTTILSDKPIGTGPFKWGTRTPGDNITLIANTDYHGDGPYLEQSVLRYVPDMTSLFAQFRTGQVDTVIISGIPHNFYEEAKALPDREVFVVPAGNIECIMPNLEHAALKDKAVRQALYFAMNKQVILDAIYYGIPKGTESYLPRESWAFNPNLPAHVYDPEKANALLDEAGWVRSGNTRTKDGVQLSFKISTTTGNELREQVQQFVMQDWAAIGVQVTIENMPAAVIWGDFYVQSKFESLLVGTAFRTGVDPDPAARFASTAIPRQGGSGGNYMQWKNEEVDKLLIEGQKSFDQNRRTEIYQRLQEIVREEMPILPTFQYAPVEGYKKGLQGFLPNLNQRQNAWNMGQWYWAS